MSPRDGNRNHPLAIMPDAGRPEPDLEVIDRIATDVRKLPARPTIGQRRLLQVLGREMRTRSRIGHPVKHQDGWLHELYCRMPAECTC